MKNRISLSLLFFMITLFGYSQKWTAWITYSQSKFLYCPGLETNYSIFDRLGINVAVGSYIQSPKKNQITNKEHDSNFSFYDANIGVCSNLFHPGNSSFGTILGVKVYYGPDFRKLHYYKQGGYYIYYDQSFYRPEFGLDIGLYYVFRRISFLTKFDFARNRFRLGIGYMIK